MRGAPHPTEPAHPTPARYLFVGFVLAVVTLAEVGAYYWDVSGSIIIPIFLVLSVGKFALVVMVFMHLQYDHKLFASFFVGGLMLGLAVVLALITLFNNFDIGSSNIEAGGVSAATPTPRPTVAKATPTPTVPPEPGATQTPTPGGELASGAQVFLDKGCGACHAIDGVPDAIGVVGPKLNGVATQGATRKRGFSAEAYIRESIERPTAFVTEGFAPVMPELKGTMTDAEFESLVAFLLTLK